MTAANVEHSGKGQEDLMQFFKTWEYSLFDLSGKQKERLSVQEFKAKMWYTDALYSAAAILLKKENISSAKRYISYTVDKNPKSIHAWCNQGVYCLSQRPPQLQQAEEAAEKMKELLRDDKSKTDAKVEKAHWLYTRGRTLKCRTGALQMFEEELTNKRGDHNYSHHYFYLKALVHDLKAKRVVEDQRITLEAMVAQLTILAGSGDKTYELEMWTHLAEMQYAAVFATPDLTELKKVTGCDKPDLLYCTNKMLEIQANCPQVTISSNFYYRVGNNFLELSMKANNKEERIELLNKALRYGQEYLNTPASFFEKSPALCAKVLLWLWAINYYEDHRGEVDKYVEERDRPESVFPGGGDAKRWSYLAQCYYSVTPDVSPTTRSFLEKAKKHLEDAIKPGSPCLAMEYPRTLMLLGEPTQVVEEMLQQYKGEGPGLLHVAHKGLFYEEIGQMEKAVKCYRTVVDTEHNYRKVKRMVCSLSTNGFSRLTNNKAI